MVTKPRTEQELREIALDIVEDRIFTDRHIREGDKHLITSVFPVLIFLTDEQREFLKERANLLYAYRHKAGRMATNGYPTFTEMHWLTKEHWEVVRQHVKKLQDRNKEFLKGDEDEREEA